MPNYLHGWTGRSQNALRRDGLILIRLALHVSREVRNR